MRLCALVHLTLFDALRRRILLASVLVGMAFLAVFAVAMHFVARQAVALPGRGQVAVFVLAGLYAVNSLVVVFAVILPVDALSGEIASGVMQTLAAKPLRRGEIVLAKWLAHAVIIAGYLLLLAGGVIGIGRVMGHYAQQDLPRALALMLLEAMLLLTVSIAGGTRLSTVTNGITALGFYGLAFTGGWIEQIGAVTNVPAAKNVGIAVSLIAPADTLWRLAAYYLQPALVRNLQATPFTTASVPNALMVWWAIGFSVIVLAWSVREFSNRPL